MPDHIHNTARWPVFLVLIATGLVAARHVASWPARVQYPGDAHHADDSTPLVETVHLRQGVPIYAEYSGDRYDAANWGPLFYLLGSRLVDPVQPSYVRLRVLSMLGTL